AQLIQVKDQTHLWAREYDRPPGDLLRVEEEIARSIAEQIQIALGESRARHALPAALTPQEYEAYQAYLKGRFFWNKRYSKDLEQAVDSFQQAIAENPGDARAYAGLADSYALIGIYLYRPPAEVFPKAHEAVLKALAIDPTLAEAHASLGLLHEQHD